ncbi:MAG TPA: hypothetical protein VHM19_17245 [Polyangiales bacterium]|nr:hypothetical protein [Polyangiales bacterium]
MKAPSSIVVLLALVCSACASTRGAAAWTVQPAKAGETLQVSLKVAAGPSFELSRLRIWIDGAPATLETQPQADEAVVLRAQARKGLHRMLVALELKGTGALARSRLRMCSHRDFYAPAPGVLRMRILAYAKGDAFTPFERRPRLAFFEKSESRYATVPQHVTTPEEEIVNKTLCDSGLPRLP